MQVLQSGKYLTGQTATWGEGDWDGAPGGGPGNPPSGDGVFDQIDIVAALLANVYLSGPYAAVQPNGRSNDPQTSIVYDVSTGEFAVDVPAGTELTSINIDSAGCIFDPALNPTLGDTNGDCNIFIATFRGSFGSRSFGYIAQPGLSEDFLLGDLLVIGSLRGGGPLGDVDLIYVPEPSSVALLAVSALALAPCHHRVRNVG